MEALLTRQGEIFQRLRAVKVNFGKNPAGRRTPGYMWATFETVNLLWSEFISNDVWLAGFKRDGQPYYTEDVFGQAKLSYEAIYKALCAYASEQAGQRRSRLEWTPSRQTVSHRLSLQGTYFQAFQRLIKGIKIDAIMEKWQFDDELQYLQSLWAVIFELHLQIDYSLQGSDRAYDEEFDWYANLYEDTKRSLYTRLGSVVHRQQATPQLEIPVFSGTYTQWLTCYNSIREAVHTNTFIQEGQKMQHLKEKREKEEIVSSAVNCHVALSKLADNSKHWELEDNTTVSHIITPQEEKLCCLEDGADVGGIPIKMGFEQELELSKPNKALALCKQVGKKLQIEQPQVERYKQFIKEYQGLGYMRRAEIAVELPCYLPRQYVLKSDATKTKLRAWAKTSTGQCLNDDKQCEQDLQQDLQTFIVNWRQFKYVITADIERMFCTVFVKEADQQASFYMDDLLAGGNSAQEADKLQQQIINILLVKGAGMKLRKWASNDPRLFRDLTPDQEDTALDFRCTESRKTLGLQWSASTDCFTFRSKLEEQSSRFPTKRQLLSDISKWKQFVANRLQQVTSVIKPGSWYHVRSKDNAADCATRELTEAQLLEQKIWWEGPEWPLQFKPDDVGHTCYVVPQSDAKKLNVHTAVFEGDKFITSLLNRHESVARVARTLAWISRFITQTRSTQSVKCAKYLTSAEVNSAYDAVSKFIQGDCFNAEIASIQDKGYVHRSSKIVGLNPFLDNEGLIRVGGWLANASISEAAKHAIILPSHGRFTQLIIEKGHKATFHGGARLTLSYLRNKYWIMGGMCSVKRVLRKCVRCRRFEASTRPQIMADLPAPRVTPSRTFEHTGVDFTGWFAIKANTGRGIRTTKGYVAIFVCLATKAVHLELVSDLSTPAFLAAFRRFCSRRGSPKHMWSDNGGNFVGASRVLKKEYQEIAQTIFYAEFFDSISHMDIEWHFNAPAWSSAGGLWEAAVKSFKYHLRRVVGEQKLTYEEFSTLIQQIEACMNSRPLGPLTENPEDEVLTARAYNGFLIIEIKLPIVSSDIFELDKVISVPQKKGHQIYEMIPIFPYFAFNLQKDAVLLICSINKPTYSVNIKQSICDLEITGAKPTLCRPTMSACADKWVKLHRRNVWLYACCTECKIRIFCATGAEVKTLQGNGLIDLGQGCTLKSETVTIHSHSNFLHHMKIEPSIEIPMDTSILNHFMNTTISLSTFTEANADGQPPLKELKQQIEQLKEQSETQMMVHNVHHYTAVYVFVAAAVTASCAAAYWRHYKGQRRGRVRTTEQPRAEPPAASASDRIVKVKKDNIVISAKRGTAPSNLSRVVQFDGHYAVTTVT